MRFTISQSTANKRARAGSVTGIKRINIEGYSVATACPRRNTNRLVHTCIHAALINLTHRDEADSQLAYHFALAAINSIGIVPAKVGKGATMLATGLLVCAVTATGIRSPMQTLLQSGPKPLLIILIASLVALVLACLTAGFLLR